MVGEVGLAHDLLRKRCRERRLFGESRGAYHELRREERGVVHVLVHLGEEAQVAEGALNERVDLRCAMMRGAELAEHHREHRHVGQLVEGNAAQVEVTVRVRDAVTQTRDRLALVERERALARSLADRRDGQLRELRHVGGIVGCLLCGAQRLHVGAHLLEVVRRHARGCGGETVGLGVLLERLDGNHLSGGRMVVFKEEFTRELLEVAFIELAAQALEQLVVAQVRR